MQIIFAYVFLLNYYCLCFYLVLSIKYLKWFLVLIASREVWLLDKELAKASSEKKDTGVKRTRTRVEPPILVVLRQPPSAS